MKKSFPGYYRPTDEEFSELWNSCLFVLDTNVLLNLYRYSPETRDEFLGILEQIADRLWIPHQVGLEYQEKRLSVIAQQKKAYDQVRGGIEKAYDSLERQLSAFRRHPFIVPQHLLERIETVFSQIKQEMEEYRDQHPDFLDNDSIRDDLTRLFDGKVGPAYPTERRSEIHQEGQERYEAKVPPGYGDKNKAGEKQYGDLILWYQMLDKAKEAKQPIIFISDDRKEDWWWKSEGKIIGPRPELVQEMLSEAGVSFYMYPPERFMEYAKDYLEREIKQDAIDEVRKVGEEYDSAEAARRAEIMDRQFLWLGGLEDEARRAAMFEEFNRQRLQDMARAPAMFERLYPRNYQEMIMASAMFNQPIRSRLEGEGRILPGAPTGRRDEPTSECDDNGTAQDRGDLPGSEPHDEERDREENGEDE